MRLLLDSNVLVRMAQGLVGPRLTALLNDADNQLFASIASIWELAIKAKRADLRLPADFPSRLVAQGCAILPITTAHAWSVAALPRLHGDPFDRLLVAQALAERLVLVTSDRELSGYGVALIRA